MTIPAKHLVFTGSDARCPCIYLWKRGADVFYVGRSMRGLRRPLDDGHHRLYDMETTDTLEVYFYPGVSLRELEQIERELIRDRRPSKNGTLTELGVRLSWPRPPVVPVWNLETQGPLEHRPTIRPETSAPP